MYLATITPSLSSSPSTTDADSAVETQASANIGIVTISALCWLILNGIVALCLVWAGHIKKARRVAEEKALELPAGDISAELKEDGIHELGSATPELNEDTFHEMFVLPVELTGDFWPEMNGWPS